MTNNNNKEEEKKTEKIGQELTDFVDVENAPRIHHTYSMRMGATDIFVDFVTEFFAFSSNACAAHAI